MTIIKQTVEPEEILDARRAAHTAREAARVAKEDADKLKRKAPPPPVGETIAALRVEVSSLRAKLVEVGVIDE